MTTTNSKTEAMRERIRSLIPVGGKDGPTQGVKQPFCRRGMTEHPAVG